ncbi:hypothetical protein [Streptomyces sp. NPDC058664]|uniref:hypothetical protein n=1 Tax=unclassified Streptomyces TaxID=2593676 RepID=UPI00365A9426
MLLRVVGHDGHAPAVQGDDPEDAVVLLAVEHVYPGRVRSRFDQRVNDPVPAVQCQHDRSAFASSP